MTSSDDGFPEDPAPREPTDHADDDRSTTERPAPGDRPRPRRLSSRVAYRNPWMTVREDRIERPAPGGGTPRPGIYAVVEKPHAAAVVPWDGTHLHLVGQFRYPLGAWSWEFPQGAVHGEDATPEQIARAELREETGFEAGRMQRLADLAFAPGMADQTFTAWLASDLRAGAAQPEPEEQGMIVPCAVTVEQFDAMVDAGEIVDAATIATWFFARRVLVG